MNIGVFETLPGYGGGNIYQNNAIQALEKKHTLTKFQLSGQKYLGNRLGRIFQGAQIIRNHNEIDLWIATYLPTIAFSLVPSPRNVVSLFYHLDDDIYPNKILSFFLRLFFFRQARKSWKVVAIANYWKEYLKGFGINNPIVIYWGFERELFNYPPEVSEEFRNNYNLLDKPIIYLGNCQRNKGVVESYQALNQMDAHFITSGKEEVKLPARNLNLNYEGYRKLLFTSNVAITMSLFKEGWNATAHEAMLAKTPVIGSGLGGMAELLDGGGQIVCKTFLELPDRVLEALSNSQNFSISGYEFASQFTVERFERDWIDLLV